MFRRENRRFLDGKPIEPNDAGTTVVGEGAVFSGDLVTGGDVVIGGEVRGGVETGGRLHLRSSGLVDGSVAAADAKIEGTVDGPIVVPGKLEIGATARVMGDIRAGRLAIAEGSLVQGSMHTETEPQRFSEARGGRDGETEQSERYERDEYAARNRHAGRDRIAEPTDDDTVEQEQVVEDAVPV